MMPLIAYHSFLTRGLEHVQSDCSPRGAALAAAASSSENDVKMDFIFEKIKIRYVSKCLGVT